MNSMRIPSANISETAVCEVTENGEPTGRTAARIILGMVVPLELAREMTDLMFRDLDVTFADGVLTVREAEVVVVDVAEEMRLRKEQEQREAATPEEVEAALAEMRRRLDEIKP